MEKMANFDPKPWTNPFGKTSIFQLFELLVLIAQKGVFSFQKLIKHIFLAYSAKQKGEKMANFGPRPWTTPFGKISIFRLLELLVFCSLERCFFVLECHKTHFSGLYCLKKQVEKWPNLDQNHGLTPIEKCRFFDFLNFLFLMPRKAFFRSRIS